MEDSFTKVRNITYDCFVFYSCKQQKGESVGSFYGRLIELAENCNLGSEETTLIRDAFILNMLDHETQKELLKETVEPSKALEIAIQMEMGAQNQQKINQNLMSGTTSVNLINSNPVRNCNANGSSTKRDFTRYPTVPQNYHYTSVCTNCGLRWSHNHKQICPANGKKCSNCGIMGHFARKCRKPKKSQNPIQKTQKSNVNQIDQWPEKSDDEESVNSVTSYQQLYEQVYDSNYDSDSDDYVAAISSDSVHQLEPLNVEVQMGEIRSSPMIDSGSAVSIITKSLANKIIRSTKSAKWTDTTEKRNLKTFSNEPIKIIGHLETTVIYNQWTDTSAMLTVVDDGHKNIIGRDLFTTLGLAVVQQQPETGKCVYNINNSTCKIQETIATQFPYLVSRIGLSKTHVAKSKFHLKCTAKHQKGRRVPINLQPRVSVERLQTEGHIEKLSSCSDEHFISTIVITVKKDQSIKLALDSKVLNKAIHKNKYQMPNIEMLIDTISQHLTNTQNGQQAYFTTLDLKYAYSQLKLHHDTAKHCNFNIICGESTGTYRFKNGFYGLTDMPADFQKAMDYTLRGLQNTYCFLDDIITVSTGTEADHLAYVYKCPKKLDDDNLRINLQKCHFAKSEIEWLGYKFTQTGISPLESKTAAILTIPPPTTLKRLRSFLGSVHYIGKFIPHLAQLCHPLRPLLKKICEIRHFDLIKEKIANSTENSHYNPKLDVRVKCDASRSGLGAALEQNTPDGWKPIAFASRFLYSTEERYSVNELELLGIVWSIDYFKYYLYGKNFTVVTDHRALLSILKEHRSNKSYNSRLSRWIDRLLPYNFTIEHMPGAEMGLVDYISRNPFARAKKISTYDEHFVVATISKIRDSMKHLIINKQTATKKFKSILKSNLPLQIVKRPFAPRLPTSLSVNSPNCKEAFASQLTTSHLKTPFVPQLKLPNSKINSHSEHPFASQMPLKVTKLQFALNNRKVNNSHSNNKFAAKEVQMSDSKECEQSEQLSPIQPINGIK